MDIAPLQVGVEIKGVALDRPVSHETAEELRQLLAQHQMLVFRAQNLSPEDQVRVLGIFGPVLDEKSDGLRYQYVSGEKTSVKPGRLLFHSDNHFTPVPLELLSLYGEKVDESATPTLFVDNVAGYERLSSDCRAMIDDKDVINRSFFFLGLSDQPARELPEDLDGGPVARHPAVWHHPETGKPFVYLTELHAWRLDGMEIAESRRLLDQVFETLYDPETVHSHKRSTGDLVIWNNRTVQHARGALDGDPEAADAARSVRRVSTGTHTFTKQFQFAPDVIAKMGDFYQRSVSAEK